jgi:putative aldouronate transport system permease protein
MSVIKESPGDRVFNLLNLLVLTIVLVIVLFPLIHIVAASVSDPDYVSTGKVLLFPRGFNIEGYKKVFQYKDIMIGYRNTIFYTIVGTLVNLAVTLPAAYALSKKRLMGRNGLMFFMAFTMYFSGGMIPTYILIRDLNLLNTYAVLVVSGAVNTTNLIICRTFFTSSIPSELEEAAMIDGCSTTRTFLTIVLPLSKALLGVMVLYYGIGHWNSYFNALIYLTDRSKVPLQLVLREILIEQEMASQMLESGAAVSDDLRKMQMKLASLIKYSAIVVSSLPVLIVYPFLQKYFEKGVMLGSLKG